MSARCMCGLSLLLYLGAVALLAVGIATPVWIKVANFMGLEETQGLWQHCSPAVLAKNKCVTFDFENMTTRYYITVALILLAALTALIAGCVYAVLPVSGVFQLVAGGCAAAGVILYATEGNRQNYLGYSFGLAAGAAGLFVLNSFLIFCLAGKRGCRCHADLPCRDDFV